MKLMIVYATTEGHTRTVAKFLEKEAGKSGHKTGLFNANIDPPSLDGYDAVIVAGSVHMGKYQTSIEHFVKKYHEKLNTLNSAFLSISLAAASNDEESWKELEQQTTDFLVSTSWKPAFIEYVAGALLYTQYDFFKRFVMRLISKKSGGDTDTSHDHVYTNWKQVQNVIQKLES
jgi:menaquinone-dependent protoporphyrinogen oxidase